MTYAVKADMQAEFGDSELIQLTDRTGAGAIDDAVLTRALDRASEEIDSYVAQRYTLPLASVPTSLKGRACDMARFYLFDARAPQIVQDRYKNAVSWLKDVAMGKATLGADVGGNVIPDASGTTFAMVASDQVFTDDVLACQ